MIFQIEYEYNSGVETQSALAPISDLELSQSIHKQKRIQGIDIIIWILELDESSLKDRILQDVLELVISLEKTSRHESTGIMYIDTTRKSH